MRTRNTQDIALMEASSYGQQSTFVRVEIDTNGSGVTYVDVTNWNGYDFVDSVTYRESLDSPAWSAEVKLVAWMGDRPDVSISPGMANSVVNQLGVLCKPYNRVRISTAVVPKDAKPLAADYNKVFDGRILKWKQAGSALTLTCVDRLVGDLMRRVMETQIDYGTSDPATSTAEDIQEIVQNILDDHINTTASAPRTSALSARGTLGVPYHLHSFTGTAANPWQAADDTNATIRLYSQARMTIWDAISAVAGSIAFQLRARWMNDATIDDFRLVLEEPDRSPGSVTATIDPTLTQAKISGCDLSVDNIRNRIRIGYERYAGARDSYFTNDAPSEALYGPLYMEINVGTASQVDTDPEAQRMGDGILQDTARPTIQITTVAPYHWAWQLNDFVKVQPDNIHIDTAQNLAVISRTNTIAKGTAGSTQLTLRGFPASRVTRHITAQRDPKPPAKAIQIKSTVGTTMHTNSNFADNPME